MIGTEPSKATRNRIFIAMCGVVMNLIVAVFLVLMALRHPKWDAPELSPEARVGYYQKPLRVLCNQALPLTAGIMVFSAALFWTLRKN